MCYHWNFMQQVPAATTAQLLADIIIWLAMHAAAINNSLTLQFK